MRSKALRTITSVKYMKYIMLLCIALPWPAAVLQAQSDSLPWQRMLASQEMVNRYLVDMARKLTNESAAEFQTPRPGKK